MKKFLALFLVLMLFCACTPKPKDLTEGYSRNIENLTGAPSEKFKTAQQDFAVELLKQNFKNENTLVSPISVKLALAMTLNGADGETKTQMEAVLGSSTNELNEEIYKYVASLSDNEIHIANSIWIKDAEGFSVKEDFLQTNANYYNAGVYKAPFDDSTAKQINSWVKENTHDMIDSIIDVIDPGTVMYLINALAFEAEWSNPYTENQVSNGTFTSISGETRSVKMMNSTEYSYLEDENATGFIKNYSGGNYAFVALLPKGDITEFINSLEGKNITDIIKSKSTESVITKLPKFSYAYSQTLNDSLINMGMPNAFDPSLAKFNNISDTPLFINRVIHKTYIEVGEKGTKAGAVTAVETNGAAAPMDKPKEVILDRPFVYMIIDTENNLPLFIGALTDVK